MGKVNQKSKRAFALPTVLLSSIVMIMILVTAVSVTSSVSGGLREQYYTNLASRAADAGVVMAQACMDQSGGEATWSDAKPLKPNTDCSGNVDPNRSPYVLEMDDIRTYFTVGEPMLGAGNVPVSAASKGYSEVLRNSSGIAWRVWGSDTSVVLAAGGDVTPVGTYIEGAWTTAPSGYLLADGSAVSRTTYANLFAVIGTTYGSGNGSTTFNLPDFRGRVTVQKSTDTEFDVLGERGGEKTHTLTIDEMPSHTHIQNPHRHYPPVAVIYGGNAGNYRSIFATNSGFWSGGDSNNATTNTTATNRNTGGDDPHNNLQPYATVNRAIKY